MLSWTLIIWIAGSQPVIQSMTELECRATLSTLAQFDTGPDGFCVSASGRILRMRG
jgi:hypothetical protein